MDERSRTLTEKVADEILTMIQQRHYIPGDKLPTEKELCERMNAGRNTVREALKILASRNVLVIRQGSGSFISDKQGVADDPLGFAMMDDPDKLTRDLIQIRVIIEPPIAALAAQCALQADILSLKAIFERMEDQILKREDFAQSDVDFHIKVAECSHNIVMQNLIPVISKGVIVFARNVSQTEYDQTLVAHRKIYECIARHKPFEAELEMRFHLLFNRERYLKEIENKP